MPIAAVRAGTQVGAQRPDFRSDGSDRGLLWITTSSL
jgi:hypothetical protein